MQKKRKEKKLTEDNAKSLLTSNTALYISKGSLYPSITRHNSKIPLK